MDRNNKFKDKEQVTKNWNSGDGFNQIIRDNKINFMEAQGRKDLDDQVDILNSDLDFTEERIMQEADKRGEKNKVTPILKSLNVKMNNCHQKLKRDLNQNNLFILKQDIRYIRKTLWTIQARYGLFYPFEDKEQKDEDSSSFNNQR